MILGASATHALRALAHLARATPGGAVLGRDLAAEVGVPPDYLAKVLATLARTGVLRATRGARGGYRLARPAGEILLREIVEPFEGARARPGCLLRPGEDCREDGACSAHGAWGAVKAAYETFLGETTLADIEGPAPARRRRRPSTSKRRTHPRRSTTR